MQSWRSNPAAIAAALIGFLSLTQGGHAVVAHQLADPSSISEDPISQTVERAAFANPPASARPGIRWWWPGGDVKDQELARELSVMHEAGFGSAEIQSFAVGLPGGVSPNVNTYATPAWFDHLAAAVDRASTLGMTVDMTLGSSWPLAGTDIPDAQSLKQLTVTGRFVQGPAVFDDLVPEPVEPLTYPLASELFKFPNTYDKSKMKLVTVLAARRSDNQTQDSAASAPALQGLPNLPATVYLEAGSVVTLVPYLTSNGRLQWAVPAGNWMIFALYHGPTGSRPFYDANSGPAFVLDHFNRNAVLNSLQSVAQTAADRLGPRFGSTLQSLFVDSLELRTELYWTDDLLDEFALRRGYRLEAFLPILFRPLAADAYLNKVYPNAPPTYDIRGVGRRVRQDYDQTIAELMVERFFAPLREWSETRGVNVRVQAHGAPVDLLTAYSHASVPETEGLYGGGRPAFLKFAVSAARAAGRQVVSSEILAFKHHVATPTRILQEANKHFAAGVNQLVLHGFPYVYDDGFPHPGWMPFQSPYVPGANLIGTFGSHLNDRNPMWPFMRRLTDYLARAQVVLRHGSASADLAVYSGRLGYPDDSTYNPAVPEALLSAGYNFDYINSDLLHRASAVSNLLQVGVHKYKGLIITDGSPMSPATAGRIASLASSGVPVILVEDIPHESLGLLDFIDQRDAVVQSQFEDLLNSSRTALPSSGTLRSGSAMFVKHAHGIASALSDGFRITPDLKVADSSHDIRYVHRRSDEADYYFLTSPAETEFDVRCTFPNSHGRIPEIWDLRTGKIFPALVYTSSGTEVDVLLHFEPGTALVVGFDRLGTSTHIDSGSSLPGVYRTEDGELAGLADSPGSYMVVLNGGVSQLLTAVGPRLDSIGLPTWDILVGTRDAIGQDQIRSFERSGLFDLSTIEGYSGNARYTAFLDFTNLNPAYRRNDVRLLLDLGQLASVGKVRINDQPAATMVTAPYTVDISDYIVPGLNKFEVNVATVPGEQSAGLLGPVTLVPRYRLIVPGFKPLQTSMVVTPANFPNSNLDDMHAATARAAELVNHVNFQWFWKTPPNEANPQGGEVVECDDVSLWVQEARRLNLTVTLQFQSFYAQVKGSYGAALDSSNGLSELLPTVRVASPVAPFETASFADPELVAAYLNQIRCLADLKPEYLVLGPEVNFVNIFNHAEWLNFIPVYAKAYELAKTISPITQVGLSFQYDGLRRDLLLHNDDWAVVATGPRDFVALTTYYGFSEDRHAEFPDPALIPDDYYKPIREILGPDVPVIFSEVGWSSFFENGLATQAAFIRRLPHLLGVARPDNITWALQHDVQYFEGPGSSLNQSGLLTRDGNPKPSWEQAMLFKREGVLVDVVPRLYAIGP
jgi:hypothetical protein